MTILQKYVFREWFWTLLAVSFVLIVVLLGLFLGELLNDLATGRMPPGLLWIQLLLRMPNTLQSILPLSGFIAVMWGLGRLYRDQEMAVMRASGFHWRQLLRPLWALLVPLSAVLLVIGIDLAPRSAALADQKLEEAFRTAAIWGLQAGRFHELQNGALVVYVEAVDEDGSTLHNIFIDQTDDTSEKVWFAKRGRYWMDTDTGQRFLTLEDGQVTQRIQGKLNLRVLSFARNDLMLPEPERKTSRVREESVPTSELLSEHNASAWAELQWRVSPTIMVLVLSLLAIPLAHSNPREGRGARAVLGMLSYAIYANTLFLARTWVADGVLPASIGLWWVHLLVLLVALGWMHRQGRMPGTA